MNANSRSRVVRQSPYVPLGFALVAGAGSVLIAHLAGVGAIATISSALLSAAMAAASASFGWRAARRGAVKRDELLVAELDGLIRVAREKDGIASHQGESRDIETAVRLIARAYQSLEIERKASQELLEKRIVAQADYHARLSHELRSPLNSILGYTSLMIEDAEEGVPLDVTGDLQKIRRAGHTLLNLIDSLLQLAEDRTGQAGLDRAPFTLRDAFEQVAIQCEESGAKCTVNIAPGIGHETVFGNQIKLERAISSLIDDAVRSHGAADVRISSLESRTVPGYAEIILDVETVINAGETGKAASLSRHLAERLAEAIGGRLEIKHGGTADWRYTLYVPFDIERAGDHGPKPPIAVPASPNPDPGSPGKSAVIIDDDVATIELLSRWLERSGYSVSTATGAEDGLRLARETRPDVVLLDALMPGRSGYDVLPDMVASPELHDTPILLVTVDDDRGRGLKAGAADYVRKPVTEARLRDLLAVYDGEIDGDVLIIEDDSHAAELLERTARKVGLRTRRACDGAEGLAAMREARPSAVLLDLQMPNVSGFEVIEAIAADSTLSSIPLIVFSGQELTIKQHHALLKAGCRYHMKGNSAPRDIAVSLKEAVS